MQRQNLEKILKSDKTKTGFLLMACFVLPGIILLAVLISYGFAPFGEKSLMIMDMSGQYSEFFCGLKNISSQNGGILFSWSKALGSNYAGVFAYYVASPLSFLTLFFPNEQMHIGVMFLTILKISLCGLTFGILMNYFNKNKARNVIFAVFYAMMSYNMAYSMCLMWLDAVIWLPIIILGLEKIAKGGKPYLLCISYAFLFVSTYYISYMVGLFSCLYALYIFIREGKQFLSKSLKFCAKFAGSVFVAAGMCAWLLLPTLYSLFEGKIGNASIVPENGVNYELTRILNKFFIGAYDGITNSGTPFFYCGMIVFALYFGYFFIKSISVKEKIMTLAITLFLAISTYFYKLDVMWHVFQAPNWFPYRYFFLFGFIVIFTAAKAAAKFKEIPWASHISFSILVLGFCFYVKKIPDSDMPQEVYEFTVAFLVITVILLFAFVLLQKLGKRKDSKTVKIVTVVLFACVLMTSVAETYTNARFIFAGLDSSHRFEAYEEHRDYKILTEQLAEAAQKDSDGEFYRIGTGFQRTFNEPIALGYGGINHYSSSFNSNLNSFFKKMGFAQSWYWSSYAGSTAVTDALFSVEYVMIDDEISRIDDKGKIISWCSVPYEHYEKVMSVESAVLYKNPNVLSPCIAVSNDLSNFDWQSNGVESQNYLLNCMLGNDESYFLEITDSQSGIFEEKGDGYTEFNIEVPKTGALYAYFPTYNDSTEMTINDKYGITLFTGETDCTQFVGYFDAGESVSVRLHSDRVNTNGRVFYLLDDENFSQAVEKLQQNSLDVTSWSSGVIEGNINVSEDGFAFTSLVYDEAWSVKVDGKEVETHALQDGLMYFDITEGSHKVEIEYNVPGFALGLGITIMTVAALAVWCIFRLKNEKRYSTTIKQNYEYGE